jgi:hypothetical protein
MRASGDEQGRDSLSIWTWDPGEHPVGAVAVGIELAKDLVDRALLAAGWYRSLRGTLSWHLLVRVGSRLAYLATASVKRATTVNLGPCSYKIVPL